MHELSRGLPGRAARALAWAALLAPVAAGALGPQPRERKEPIEAAERDDPAARARAMVELREGVAPPAALVARLRAAREEIDRAPSAAGAGPRAPRTASAAAAATPVAGNDWINLGPATADFAFNAVVFKQVDAGRLRSVVPHPADPNILFIATAGGGVWKTYDAGATWDPLTDRLGALASGALAMDPHNPDVLVYGLGDPFDSGLAAPGVVTSTDGGASWSAPTLLTAAAVGAFANVVATQVRDVQIDPGASNHLLVATNVGLFSSNDFGASFQQVALPGGPWSAWSIAWLGAGSWMVTAQVLTGTTLEAVNSTNARYDLGRLGLFRSTDGAKTFSDDAAALPAGEPALAGRATLAVAPSTTGNPATARVYLLAASAPSPPRRDSTRDLYRSDDGGLSFRALRVNSGGTPSNPNGSQATLDLGHGQAWYDQAILVDPFDPDLVFAGGDLALIRTKDGGATWTVVADWLPAADRIPLPYVHADYHAIAASIATGKPVFYFGTDGGLFRSDDIATVDPTYAAMPTVSDALNRGVVSHLVYSVACAKESWPAQLQGFTIGGMQDNGTRERALPAIFAAPSGPDSFDMVNGGDGIGVAVGTKVSAAGLPATILLSTPGGDPRFTPIAFSADGGRNFLPLNAGIDPASQPFLIRYASDDADPAGDVFLTFSVPTGASATDAHVYRIAGVSTGTRSWSNITGTVRTVAGAIAPGFTSFNGTGVAPHALATHPKQAQVYLLSADAGSTFLTTDGGANWQGGNPLGSNRAAGKTRFIKGTSGLAFDWGAVDALGRQTFSTFYAGSLAEVIFDLNNLSFKAAVPDDFGHLFKTTDAGASWTPICGTRPTCGLPNVPVNTVKVDPSDAQTLYAATALGLYVSHDAQSAAPTFARMGFGLPLVEVTDICVSPLSSSITVSTYGRGFWQINRNAADGTRGVHGRGDLDLDGRLDGFDLIGLVSAMGTTQRDDAYRQEADLVGATSGVDDADLAAFLARFPGGAP
ncbi:MAG: hypothetical protein NVSMB23_25590 [Myxococcales bacterium]